MQEHLLTLAVQILGLRNSAPFVVRRDVVARFITLTDDKALTRAKVADRLGECAEMASVTGSWHLAAILRRAQDEIVHALLPTPGHNLRKVFRRKRNLYANA